MKRIFRSQLDLLSILRLSATLGFGSGIFLGLVFFLSSLQSGDASGGIVFLFVAPIASAIGNAFTGLVAYPFYAWYCDRIKGQHIAGKFAEETPTPSDSEIH